MKVEPVYRLIADDGNTVKYGDRIYDKDGHFVGNFLRFCDGNVMVLNNEMTCNSGDEIMRFPGDCGIFENWSLKTPTSNGGPASSQQTPPQAYEVCSSPEQVAYHQGERIQREIAGYLLDAAQLPTAVRDLVSCAGLESGGKRKTEQDLGGA